MKFNCIITALLMFTFLSTHAQEGAKTDSQQANLQANLEKVMVIRIPENYHPVDLTTAIRELVVDVTMPYFDEGVLTKIEQMQKERSSGEYIEHWENGQLMIRASFKNGFADGHIHGWYRDGSDAFKGFFKEGVKLGVHMSFYPPEKRKSRNGTALVLNFDENGRLDGVQKTCDPTGDLIDLVTFKNGVLDGLKTLSNRGKRIAEWHYKKGKLIKEMKK